jgi:hypothetical protein
MMPQYNFKLHLKWLFIVLKSKVDIATP